MDNTTKVTILTANCNIPDLYDAIAITLRLSTEATYNCTKVCVSQSIFEEVNQYYLSIGAEDAGFAMAWCCYGPKVLDTLTDHEVLVEEGWYIPNTTPIAT